MNRNRLIQLTILTILLFSFGTSFAQSGGTISYGETVNGTITDDDPVQSWTFEGSAGDVVTISMEAVDFADGGLDSYLQLLDSNGTVIAENDDASNVTINAEIAGFMLPADGSYTIHATRFGLETGLAVGEYSLTLTLVSGESDANATPAPGGEQSISTGQEIAGTINRSNFEDRWTFEGNAGDVISVRMSRISDSSDLDSYLQILDNENRELTQNDDSPEGIAVSEILNFELPYTGTYIIVATRYGFESGTSSGDYVLVITEGEAGTTPAEDSTPEPTETPEAESTPEPVETEQPQVEVEAIPISYGDSVSGSSPGSGVAIYTFEGTAGDVVTISVKRVSGNFNPFLELTSPDNVSLAQNDEFNGSADARIADFALPQDGIYTLAVLPETVGAGDYVLYLFTITEDEAVPTAEPEIEATASPEADESAEPESPPEPQPGAAESIDLSNATLVISLQWEGTADFDLAVTDPDGNRLDYFSTESDSGGFFGGDANGGCAVTSLTPRETVFWESEPPTGTYSIEVAHVFPCDEASPLAYTIEISLDGVILETIDGELSEGNLDNHEYTLE